LHKAGRELVGKGHGRVGLGDEEIVVGARVNGECVLGIGGQE
jgi:hypothetical protein